MVGCGLACPGGGGAGVSGCEFRGSGWGWDRRCQDPGARVSSGSWGTIPYGERGGGVAHMHTLPGAYVRRRSTAGNRRWRGAQGRRLGCWPTTNLGACAYMSVYICIHI